MPIYKAEVCAPLSLQVTLKLCVSMQDDTIFGPGSKILDQMANMSNYEMMLIRAGAPKSLVRVVRGETNQEYALVALYNLVGDLSSETASAVVEAS